MLLLYPFFSGFILESPAFTYFGIIALVTLAAFTNIRGKVLFAIDSIIAVAGVITFEFYAVQSNAISGSALFMIVNQLFAILFLASLYFSIRGFLFAGYLDGPTHEA